MYAQDKYGLMARVHVALQYLCGSAATTRRLALSVERLLHVTGQFRPGQVYNCMTEKKRRLELVKHRIRRHERSAFNAYTVFSDSFKIITSS